MATQLHSHLESGIRPVTAEDMRLEHEEALRKGPTHPGYVRARCFVESSENASGNLDPRSVEELLQETFEALAESRNQRCVNN